MAVAKSYGVKKIIAFDVEESRVAFAVKHYASVGVLSPMNKDSVEPLKFATDFIEGAMKEHGLGSGVDLTVEASGAEACTHKAVVITKPGGTSESLHSFLIWLLLTFVVIQAGLGKALSTVPLFLFTAKDLIMKGKKTSIAEKESILKQNQGRFDTLQAVSPTQSTCWSVRW
jgi:D-xylulose reductase